MQSSGMRHLAHMYAHGSGVTRSLEKAYFWLLLSASDNPEARGPRDQIEQLLSSAKRAQLQSQASSWVPKK